MAVVATITITEDYSVYAITADAVQDADDWFAARLGAASWTGATTLEKQQALITAARMLDRRPRWSGEQTDPTTPQPLQWPRDSATCDGDAVADGTIPDNIAYGEFELALSLLEDEAIQDSASTGSNVKRAKAGSAEVEFFRPTIGTPQAHQFPQTVHELVACYFDGSNSGIGAPYAGGVDPDVEDQSSSFDSCTDNYDLHEGYP